MSFFEKLDDEIVDKIEELKNEIKKEQKEIYAALLDITKSFSDDSKSKKYRDALFEKVDLLNIIIKENNKKINDLKNGDYKDNFNNISEIKIEDNTSEIEEISKELKLLEDVKEETGDKEKNITSDFDVNNFKEQIEFDNKSSNATTFSCEKADIKKELEDIVKDINLELKEDEVVEKVPILFSTKSYINTTARKNNTQLIVREENEGFSRRLKNILFRIKNLITK